MLFNGGLIALAVKGKPDTFENSLYDESLTLEVRFVYQQSDDALHRT